MTAMLRTADRVSIESGPLDDVATSARWAGWRVVTPTVVCVLIALVLRVPFVLGPLGSDEAGMLLVVRHWDPGQGRLYGDHWVDRPPLLLAFFWLADQLHGTAGVRVLACLFSVVLVLSASAGGYLLRGRSGAWWSGLVAALLGSSYVVAGHLANGMVQASALTMASCALTIAATHGRPGPVRLYGCCFAAGAVGLAAVMVKQNFVDGLAFGGAVLLASVTSGELGARRAAVALLTGLAGAAAVAGSVVLWALAVGVDLGELWFAMYEFRTRASEVITGESPLGAVHRLDTITISFVVSGLGLVVALLLVGFGHVARERGAGRYLVGVGALVVVAVVGIVLGGSWWRHYLVQLVPATALVAVLLAPRPGRWGTAMRGAVVLMGLSAAVGVIVGLIVDSGAPEEVRVGRYLGAVAREGDSGLVTWGHAEVLFHGGLTSPYEHLWSLPTRTLDPDLTQLVDTIRGPRAPTWLVEWDSFGSWRLDEDGRLADAVADRYELVGAPCGRKLFLLRGVERVLPPMPSCE